MSDSILTANTLYKINRGDSSVSGATFSNTAEITVYAKKYDSENEPTTFAGLVATSPAKTLDPDTYYNVGFRECNYIGFTGTGIVSVGGLTVVAVVEE